ncbi:MAG: hypothetical protein LBD38_02255 [Streptococcaceae bacterium]|nr:hypothetical protein [Streptococcaceae bacterium]
MKNKIYFILMALFCISSIHVSALTLDSEGRVEVANATDIKTAITAFNDNTLPTGTTLPVTFIFLNDIHDGFSDAQKFPAFNAGTAGNPKKLIIDGNNHRFTFGRAGSTGVVGEPGSSTGSGVRAREFEFGGNYIDFTLKNINIGMAILPSNIGETDADSLEYVNNSVRDATETTNGFLYSTARSYLNLRFENVNYIAGHQGKFMYLAGGGSENRLFFNGVNNIVYPSNTTITTHNSLIQGPPDWNIESGTTNFVSNINNANVDSVFYLHAAHSSNGELSATINVAEGATFHASIDRKRNINLFEADGGLGKIKWNVHGEFILDTPNPGNSTTEALKFQYGVMDGLYIHVFPNASFRTDGYMRWNVFNGGTWAFQMECDNGSVIDWRKKKSKHATDDGRLFEGNPYNTSTPSKQFINFHNPRIAAFHAPVADCLFGRYSTATSNYNYLKLNVDPYNAAYAYSSETITSTSPENDPFLLAQSNGMNTTPNIPGNFWSSTTLIPADKMDAFNNAKTIIFKDSTASTFVWGDALQWHYDLDTIFENTSSVDGYWLAPRNLTAADLLKITLRDDRAVGIAFTSSKVLALESSSPQSIEFLFKENDDAIYPLSSVQFELQHFLSEGVLSSNGIDRTITFDRAHGILAKLKPNLIPGTYTALFTWTVMDTV